ncbi:MAG: ATP-binding protein [bacterium]|nr:ATP-binding protein [bacterium]MCM1373926.1 ATP-binding protein [Muribaculum sp.]
MCQQNIDMHLFDHVLEIILAHDREGKIIYDNAAAREKLGYSQGLAGLPVGNVFPGMFYGEEEQTGASQSLEVHHTTAYRKNQTCFPVELRVVRQESADCYLCMANDVLERDFLSREVEQVRQEAQNALRVKSEFVATVTHELRTPVNGISGQIRELIPLETEKDKLRKLQLIERCCGEMNKIINNILDFSKLEAGKFTLEQRRFSLRGMIDYVVASHKGRITEKGLDFFATVSPGVPEYVVGDELRIVQVLNNLLSNAQKFTSVGKITMEVIKTAQTGESMELFFLVSDTGIGIDAKDQEKLFQSFSQVDASTSRKYGGTGLGLSISRQLVELMGGSINVESAKGRGTTFSFSIWVGRDPEEDASAGEESFVAPRPEITFGSDALQEEQDAARYGTAPNREALQKNLSKLILSVEMENWEKAEMFMETIRQLTADAPQEVSRAALRLKMAIQKENYEKISTGTEVLQALIEAEGGAGCEG